MLQAIFAVADRQGLTVAQLFATGITANEFLHWVAFYNLREGR